MTGTGAPGTGRREVFRSAAAVVVWWVWLAFAVANLADLAVQGRDHFSAEVAAVIVLITGVMYACALRPRVVADDTGITLLNPLRDHHVAWEAVAGVDLGDTLQVRTPQLAGGKSKVLYSWAVQSSRRSRARTELKAQRSAAAMARNNPGFARMPQEAREVMGKTQAELTVAQLRQRLDAVQAQRQLGQGPAMPGWTRRWAWWPIASVIVPAVAVVVVILL